MLFGLFIHPRENKSFSLISRLLPIKHSLLNSCQTLMASQDKQWLKRVLVPFWILQTIFTCLMIASAALTLDSFEHRHTSTA